MIIISRSSGDQWIIRGDSNLISASVIPPVVVASVVICSKVRISVLLARPLPSWIVDNQSDAHHRRSFNVGRMINPFSWAFKKCTGHPDEWLGIIRKTNFAFHPIVYHGINSTFYWTAHRIHFFFSITSNDSLCKQNEGYVSIPWNILSGEQRIYRRLFYREHHWAVMAHRYHKMPSTGSCWKAWIYENAISERICSCAVASAEDFVNSFIKQIVYKKILRQSFSHWYFMYVFWGTSWWANVTILLMEYRNNEKYD